MGKDKRVCMICGKTAIYGYPTDRKRVRCKTHIEPNMIDVKYRKCEFPEGCPAQPSYGKPGKQTKFCAKHKTLGDVKKHGKKCECCGREPSYGYRGGKPRFCSEHQLDLMINLKKKDCTFPIPGGCPVEPIFGIQGQRPIRCATHREANHVDLKHELCKFPECPFRPSFGKVGCKAEYCVEHKASDLVNVTTASCEFIGGCNLRPNYGYPGERAKFCSEHQDISMIDVNHEKCHYPRCGKIPTFGNIGDRPIFCKTHKESQMIDVRSAKCKECNKQPSYGMVNGVATHCSDHKTFKMVDLKHLYCTYDKCPNRAYYGKLFQKMIHCGTHKDSTEIRNPNPKCERSGCNEQPYWSDCNYPKSCETHKKPEYKNIVEKRCSNCDKLYFLINDLCDNCDTFNKLKVYHPKEARIGEVLKNNGIHYYSADRIVQDGCSKHRPDYIIAYPTFEVIVEVDEDQHKSYACECESIRMINIHQDFGGTPVIFIRYNPDGYKDQLGVNRNPLQVARERILVALIKNFNKIQNWTTPLSAIYLFYDGFDGRIECNEMDYINHVLKDVNLFSKL